MEQLSDGPADLWQHSLMSSLVTICVSYYIILLTSELGLGMDGHLGLCHKEVQHQILHINIKKKKKKI